uniref:ATP synthase subunit b, chloroplastic n=1 Tax=Helminthora furcellata TaxID=1884666 RepID=A0A1G4NZB5_9FLOR|nr:ATP synthase CF0 subunit I [Helminthora furcellata]SCW21135.1 ATP synthase CF0 subunit I [Helminthora furcellata]SCW23995.1 ATP synthase CF0 subunit I [Helminthora furcellata]
MDDFSQIFSQLAHHEGFGFNTDFLEANVINIGLLLSGLIYILKNFLGSTLVNRQGKVLLAIQESEQRLKQANERLVEAERQLAQTQIVIKQIQQEAEKTAQKVRNSILDQGKIDIEKLTAAGKNSIANAEQQIKKQIQQQIAALAVHKVTMELEEQLSDNVQLSIIDNNISKLGSTL